MRWLALVLGVGWFLACSGGLPPSPLPREVGEARLQDVRTYEGEALFDYMDGGAELYHEYGFRRLWVGDYRSDSRELRAEVFEMEDPSGAFGLLTYEGGGKEVAIGDGGSLDDGTLCFRKGRYFCRVSGVGAVVSVAEAIAKGLEGEGAVPEVIRYLPEGVREYVYFRGPLALNNFYFLSHEDVLGLGDGAEGVAFRKGKGFVIVVKYPDPSRVEKALHGLSVVLKGAREEEGILLCRSRRGWGAFKGEEGLLLLALDFPSPEEALRALSWR